MSLYEKIVWQPSQLYQAAPAFDILLDRKFAAQMINTKLTPENQRLMNLRGEAICDKFRYRQPSPYIFHKDTGFITQMTIDGGRGTWLEVEGLYGKLPDLTRAEPITYKTHNVDTTSDTLALLSLFDCWITYSSVFKQL